MFLRKNKNVLKRSDNEICAPADGLEIALAKVNDPVFAGKMMGDGTAFELMGHKVTICAPANGLLTMVYPTGHAFGLKMKNGVEILIHIGIDTVEANGQGFEVLQKQGQAVRAGDPIVRVNLDLLSKTYDMTTMCIITNDQGCTYHFDENINVKTGDVITTINQ